MTDNRPINEQPQTKEQPENKNPAAREKWRRDHWGGLFPGLALILLGVLLFSANRGWLSWGDWWQYFLIGLGAIFLIEAAVRYKTSDQRHGTHGRVVPGVVLIAIGVAFLWGFSEWWPLILVAAGVIILLNLWFRRR